MFFFKRNKIELIAYTDSQDLLEMFPVVPSKMELPAYYKTLESRIPNRNGPAAQEGSDPFVSSTIRGCYGANTFNTLGFTLPLWCEYNIYTNDNEFEMALGPGIHQSMYHRIEEYKGALDKFHILKLISPWQFKCSENIKWLQTQNYYGVNSDIWHTVPGMIDFKNQSSTNMFLAFNRSYNGEIALKAGIPLVKFIPLTDKEVVLRRELVDNIGKVTRTPRPFFFLNGLTKMVKSKNEARAKYGSCPFHYKKSN